MLLGELDRGVAGEAGVLDGVDPGEDRIMDAFVAVGVGGDLETEHVRLVGDRLHLVIAELLGADRIAEREHSASRADLDDLGAIFVHPADLLARLLRAGDDPRRLLVPDRRWEAVGVVAMPAGRSEQISGGDDPRSDHPAAVDRLLQADIVEIRRTDIAYGREARIDRLQRIVGPDGCPEGVSIFETLIAA